MKRKLLPMAAACVLCASVLFSCEKTPKAVQGEGIMHAQGKVEQNVKDIVASDKRREQPRTEQPADNTPPQTSYRYEGTIGTKENRINISAEVPAIPENIHKITLKPNDGLDKDTLLAFLDSDSADIKDMSEECRKEMESVEISNTTGDEPVFYSNFGDHSALKFSDGNKEASFTYHTGAGYIDNALIEKCHSIYGSGLTETLITPDRMDEGSFSANDAEKILLDKLKVLGISEVAFDEIYYDEGAGYSFYTMRFSPAYDGIKLDIGHNSYGFGQVCPNGYAHISEEGVAELGLHAFCGKIEDKEPVEIISFEQALEVLEQYLDSGIIEADENMTYDRVELNYYPVPNPSPKLGEIEYKTELELIPIWCIYMPLDEYVSGAYNGTSAICINAITGENI